ncbi:MAG: STAS domain-containing protein [Pirellulales bacterium]
MSADDSLIASAVHGSTLSAVVLSSQLKDSKCVDQLKKELMAALAVGSCTNVILDLSNVQFIGSIAFLAFLSIRRLAGIQRVILTGLTDQVREVFSICRLIPTVNSPTAPFEECESVADALHMCGEGGSIWK